MCATFVHRKQLMVLAPLVALGACAVDAPREAPVTSIRGSQLESQTRATLGRVYLRLDGSGAAPEDEFVPPEHDRYLAILEQSLEASGLFSDVRVATGRAVPRDGLVIDVDLDARIDAEHSSSNAALFFIFPVHTEGLVHGRFELRRDSRVLATFEYDDHVVTRVVPAAELAGRTWIEKGGSLPRLAGHMTADLAQMLAAQGNADAYLAQQLDPERPRG